MLKLCPSRLKNIAWKKLFRRLFFAALIGGAVALALLFGIDYWIAHRAEPYLFETPSDVPGTHVVLVLGTSKYIANGNENVYYRNRIRTAAELYKKGKTRCMILSGDNGHDMYNEPEMMRQDLVALGVPDSILFLDYAGFRTFDSIVRAKAIFDADSILIVSQKFHNQRAIFIARAQGIQACAVNADDVPWRSRRCRQALREIVSRTLCVMDVYVLQTKPRFFGEKVSLEKPQRSL